MNDYDHIYLDIVEKLDKCERRENILSYLFNIIEKYDLKTAEYFASNLPNSNVEEPYIAATYSLDWVEHYKKEKYVEIDPILALGFSSLLPVDWRQLPISSNRHRKFFGEAVEYGLGHQGLTIPVCGRLGERALFTITSDVSDHEWNTRCRWMMRDFASIAHHFHQMILRVEGMDSSEIDLAPREIECLRWAAHGKTAAEIGIILSISERTAEHYINQAKRKLDATNITQAVIKAKNLSVYYRHQKTR